MRWAARCRDSGAFGLLSTSLKNRALRSAETRAIGVLAKGWGKVAFSAALASASLGEPSR